MPESSKSSKIDAKPLLPFLFLIFLIIEAVKLAGPVGDVGLELASVFEQVHGKELFAEVAPVKLDVEDGFVEVLQLAERKFFGQEAKAEGVFLDAFLEPGIADIEDLPVVKGHFGESSYSVPMKFVGKDL